MATEIIVQHQQLESNAEENISKSSNNYDVSVQNTAPNMDALRILEPVRKKLASIEAERIISVIEKTTDKIQIVTLIPYIIANHDRFSVALGLELMCALREHGRLEKHLDFAFGKLFNVGYPEQANENSIDKVEMKKKEEDIQILQKAFGTSVKNILRLFKRNPSACQIIQSGCHARSRICVDLTLVLMELRDFVFERLLITPSEDKEKFEYVQKIIKRDKQNTEIIATLEVELTAAIQNKENEMLKKNEIIRKLKNNLLQLELFSQDYIRQIKQDAEKQQLNDQKDSEGKIAKYHEEIGQLRTQLNNMITEHRASEVSLRKRKYKIETEIENWIQKYDADLQEKQDEYEQLLKIHKDELILLRELEQKIGTLEPEYTQIVEERKIKEEKKKAKEHQAFLMGKAAITNPVFLERLQSPPINESIEEKEKRKRQKEKMKIVRRFKSRLRERYKKNKSAYPPYIFVCY